MHVRVAGMNVVIADLRPDHIERALAGFADTGRRQNVHAIELAVTDRGPFAGAVLSGASLAYSAASGDGEISY